MNDFNYDNEIIEISNDETNGTQENQEEVQPQKSSNKKSKKNLKEKWNDLSNGKKATIIVVGIIVLLLVVGAILYFTLFKKEEKKDPVEELVIIEKDNYRYENGKLIFLDKKDKEIGTYDCKDQDSEKCYVAKLDYTTDEFERIVSVDEKDKEIEKNSQIYLDNYVFVYDDSKIVLYNIETKESELDLKTIKTYSTENNLVVIEDEDSKFGLIEITSEGYEYLIRCSYDNLGIINNELVYLLAQDKDEQYIIDSNGKVLSENINADVKSVNKEFIVASSNNNYSLYTYEYEEILSDYDYISLHDEIIALVKSNRLYLKDTKLNKLYEDGVRLENSNYVKKYVYDENNKLVETKKSYEIDLKDNIVTITIGKDTKKINIIEGAVSSKYSYMSYFDGKLYFYSDEEKEDILGTYACTNQNVLENADSKLNNCNIYTNDKGTSGIYNNEYVFIYDNVSIDNTKYYLYNIKEKKSKGTYSSLEIINSEEITDQIKQIYTSASYIIAESATGSNKGNFGVLEINSEKVAGKVEFKYTNITKEQNYYLMINIDNSYSIYDSNFKKISNEFDYIKIYENYYVGIKANKLNVYKYNDALGILESDLSVTNNEFTIDFTNGFDITINGTVYSYDATGKVKEGE